MIRLEDGKNYYITKEIEANGTVYVYLTSMQDISNFFIRKKDEARENLIGLKDQKEYYDALELYRKDALAS